MKCKCGKTMTKGEYDAAGICSDCYWQAIDGAQMAHNEMEEPKGDDNG